MKIFFSCDITQPIDILWLNTDKFVVAQFAYILLSERVNYIDLIKTIGDCRKCRFFHQVKSQKFVQLAETFIVSGNSCVEVTISISKINPCNWLNTKFFCFFHKINHTRSVVNICHNDNRKVVFYRLLQ